MFGKRSGYEVPIEARHDDTSGSASPAGDAVPPAAPAQKPAETKPPTAKSPEYYALKKDVFAALIETIDVAQISKLDALEARAEIRGILADILRAKKVALTAAEQEDLLDDVCNDILG